MHQFNEILLTIDKYLGSGEWFVYLLIGTGIFFTIYLKFPQIRYFKHALKIVSGKFDKHTDKGDVSHFQALATALSGTVGTGNIAGVALAIHLGGPAALLWMLITAFIGMCTKFVEVLLSHKYRTFDAEGKVAGGPMYYMQARLNIKKKNGKLIKTGYWLGSFFAVATIISSFGTGNLPQINSIANSMFATFGFDKIIVGGVLAIILGLVIVGGINRIAKVTEKLVPAMAIIYFIGAFAVIFYNFENIIPSISSIFTSFFSGSAATGGFLGASLAYAFKLGVNRGLFSNEAGQGSAPIAHAAAKAHEPVSEGMVSILEPFVDTIIICFTTGLVLLSSGVWNQKFQNQFQFTDVVVLQGVYSEKNSRDAESLAQFVSNKTTLPLFSGQINVEKGTIINNQITILNLQSVAENVVVTSKNQQFDGTILVENGKIKEQGITLTGKSLLSSTALTIKAFNKGFFGDYGQYIVAIGLLLFAFSTVISWSYYGDRAVTYLWGTTYVLPYRLVYVAGFFVASFTDTTLIWTLSGIAIAIMTIPNLIGMLILHREVKETIKKYWIDFSKSE